MFGRAESGRCIEANTSPVLLLIRLAGTLLHKPLVNAMLQQLLREAVAGIHAWRSALKKLRSRRALSSGI